MMTKTVREWVMPIVIPLLTAGIIGVGTAIYTGHVHSKLSEQRAEYMSAQLAIIESDVKEIQSNIYSATANRWTKEDHRVYAAQVEIRINRIEDRLNILERLAANRYSAKQTP